MSLSLSSDSGETNHTVTLNLTLTYPSDPLAAGFNLDIYYDREVLEIALDEEENPLVVKGPVLIAAEKDLEKSEYVHPYHGALRILVGGINSNIIQAGEVAAISFKIKIKAPSGPTNLEITNLEATNPEGYSLDILKNDGSIGFLTQVGH